MVEREAAEFLGEGLSVLSVNFEQIWFIAARVAVSARYCVNAVLDPHHG
jgi:hypothetical protein